MKILEFFKLFIPKTHNRIPVTLVFFAGLLLAPVTCLDILQAINISGSEKIIVNIECGEYKFISAFVLILFALIYHYLITGRMENAESQKRADNMSLIQAKTQMALALSNDNDTPLDGLTIINQVLETIEDEN